MVGATTSWLADAVGVEQYGRIQVRLFWLGSLALVLLCVVCTPTSATENSVGVTVADSIAMTRIVDPRYPFTGAPANFKFSPDRRSFVIVTSKGKLESDTVVYQLLLFRVEDVLSFVNDNDQNQLPAHKVIASFESRPINTGLRRPAGISGVRWLQDSRSVAFVAEPLDKPAQVYAVDVETNEIRQLTDHHSHVRRFDIAGRGAVIVFVARDDPPDWHHRNHYGYAVESTYFRDLTLLQPDETSFKEEAFYLLNSAAPPAKKLVSDQHALVRGVWLSGDGRWAIGQAYANDVPADWLAEYESWKYIGVGQARQVYEGNSAFSASRSQVTRFVLIDTETGDISAVLRSPAAVAAADVLWSRDSQRAVIVNTHMPLEGVSRRERERRAETASIVEFDVESRTITPIGDFPTSFGAARILGAQLLDDSTVLVNHQARDGSLQVTAFSRQEGRWTKRAEGVDSTQNARLALSIRQDMNTPPDVLGKDNVTGNQRLISDLNPQLRTLSIGRMEEFDWTDANGRQWKGGLLLPPDFDGMSRYPLVIQTYGFSSREFVVDGPRGITSAFAARPLSTKGMIVLQMHDRPETKEFKWVTPSEGPNFVAAFEAAIDALDDRGIIDRNRVGIIGWSRTGMHVSYAVAFSKYRFAAATIADSTEAGYLGYVWSYGQPFPGMLFKERLLGAPFWGEDRQTWLDRSPTLNAHKVRTPLRIESYGTELNPYWGLFAEMKLRSRPVEMIHIPIASHLLQRPVARYTSQQGNVDWFAFWLQGHEDPDPSKADQYDRWRKLRQQHEVPLRPDE